MFNSSQSKSGNVALSHVDLCSAFLNNEMAVNNPFCDLPGTHAVVKSHVRDLVNQVHGHHSGDQLNANRVLAARRQLILLQRVFCETNAVGFDVLFVFACADWTPQNCKWSSLRTRVWQWVERNRDVQNLFPLTTANIACDEFTLQRHEMSVQRQLTVVDKERMTVAHVAIRVQVA